MSARSRLLVALAIFCAAPEAHAQDTQMFRSPSGNIVCVATEIDGVAGVRCDLDKMAKQSLKRPKDCDLDFGHAYTVDEKTRRGIAMCYGDTALGPEGQVVPYGDSWRWRGLTCASSPAGMRCSNTLGAGFEISRERQRVF